MSRFQVYINPFNDSGAYSNNYIDVTKDVVDMSGIKQSIDSNEFDVGIFKYDYFRLNLNNIVGLYSDVGDARSIFRYKRSDSIVRVTWSIGNDITECGLAVCGDAYTNLELTVFEGLLNDESLVMAIGDQKLNFTVLSFDALFDKTEVNFGSLSNGQAAETILYTILNQTNITNILTVSAGNISTDYNAVFDDVSGFESMTVREAIQDILIISNSVLYIKDRVVYVSPRDPSADLKKTFYGQASFTGIENITNINNIRSGLNKVFNFVTWQDISLTSRNTSSITQYGIRKKEIDFPYITTGATRQAILDAIKTEFGDIKREMILTTPMDYTTLALGILDKVNIDYPTVFKAVDGTELPILGAVVLGSFSLPIGEWSFTINTSVFFKIMDKNLDIKNQQLSIRLREI